MLFIFWLLTITQVNMLTFNDFVEKLNEQENKKDKNRHLKRFKELVGTEQSNVLGDDYFIPPALLSLPQK